MIVRKRQKWASRFVSNSAVPPIKFRISDQKVVAGDIPTKHSVHLHKTQRSRKEWAMVEESKILEIIELLEHA